MAAVPVLECLSSVSGDAHWGVLDTHVSGSEPVVWVSLGRVISFVVCGNISSTFTCPFVVASCSGAQCEEENDIFAIVISESGESAALRGFGVVEPLVVARANTAGNLTLQTSGWRTVRMFPKSVSQGAMCAFADRSRVVIARESGRSANTEFQAIHEVRGFFSDVQVHADPLRVYVAATRGSCVDVFWNQRPLSADAEDTSTGPYFCPSHQIRCGGAVEAVEWQQLEHYSVVLVHFCLTGGARITNVFAVMDTGDFDLGKQKRQLLLTKSITHGEQVYRAIPTIPCEPSVAPRKIRMLSITPDGALNVHVWRFSRFSCPTADRGYSIASPFDPSWGTPTAVKPLPMAKKQGASKTLVNVPPCIDAIVSFSSGVLAHVSLQLYKSVVEIRHIIACGSGGQTVGEARLNSKMRIRLLSDGVVVLQDTQLRATLGRWQLPLPDAADVAVAAPPAPSPEEELDAFIAAKCPEKARFKEVLLKAVNGDHTALLRQLELKFGPASTSPPAAVATPEASTTDSGKLAFRAVTAQSTDAGTLEISAAVVGEQSGQLTHRVVLCVAVRIVDLLRDLLDVVPGGQSLDVDREAQEFQHRGWLPSLCKAYKMASVEITPVAGQSWPLPSSRDVAAAVTLVKGSLQLGERSIADVSGAALVRAATRGDVSFVVFQQKGADQFQAALLFGDEAQQYTVGDGDGSDLLLAEVQSSNLALEFYLATTRRLRVWALDVTRSGDSLDLKLDVAVDASSDDQFVACDVHNGSVTLVFSSGKLLKFEHGADRDDTAILNSLHVSSTTIVGFHTRLIRGFTPAFGKPVAVRQTGDGCEVQTALGWFSCESDGHDVKGQTLSDEVVFNRLWCGDVDGLAQLVHGIAIAESVGTSLTDNIRRLPPLSSLKAGGDGTFTIDLGDGAEEAVLPPPRVGIPAEDQVRSSTEAKKALPDTFWSDLDTALENLPTLRLKNVDSHVQMRLLAVLQALKTVADTSGVDAAAMRLAMGWKFREIVKKLRLGEINPCVSSVAAAWAVVSETHAELFDTLFQSSEDSLKWAAVRDSRLVMWMKTMPSLRTVVESVAKAQFAATRDPKECALMYIACKKVKHLATLCRAVNNPKLEQFFNRDFSVEKNRNAASANGFAAVSKGSVEYGVAFFLLAGDRSMAVKVLLQRTGDWQLALLIVRLETNDDPAAISEFLELLREKVTEENLERPIDAFESFGIRWRAGNPEEATRLLLQEGNSGPAIGIADYATRHVTVLTQKRRTIFAPDVVGFAWASAAQQSAAVGDTRGALLGVLNGLKEADKAEEVEEAAPTTTAAPAIVADFNSGTIMLTMDSDSDDDGPGMPMVAAPAAAAASEVAESATSASKERLPMLRALLHSAADGLVARARQEGIIVEPECLNLLNVATPSGSAKTSDSTAMGEWEAIAQEALWSAFVATSHQKRHLHAGVLGRRTPFDSTNTLWDVIAKAAAAETSIGGERSFGLLACDTLVAAVANMTKSVPIASALMADMLRLPDPLQETNNGDSVPLFADRVAAVWEASRDIATTTVESWLSQQHNESIQQSSSLSFASADSDPLLALRRQFSARLRHAVVLRRLPTHYVTAEALLMASLLLRDVVESKAKGSAFPVPVSSSHLHRRRLEETLLSIIAAIPASMPEAAGRFMYKIARVLCSDVLHSTEHVPDACAAELPSTSPSDGLDAVKFNEAAVRVVQLERAPSNEWVGRDFGHHLSRSRPCSAASRQAMLHYGSTKGELLKETTNLLGSKSSAVVPPVTLAVALDRSTFDNAAVSTDANCTVIHGLRDKLAEEGSDALEAAAHERNAATGAFASDLDPSICYDSGLESLSTPVMVSHPHLPVFIAAGNGHAVALHQFGNAEASVRLRGRSHKGGIATDAAFSANGYSYAIGDSSGVVEAWRFAAASDAIQPIASIKAFSGDCQLCFVGHRTTQLAGFGTPLNGELTTPSMKLIDTLTSRAVHETPLPKKTRVVSAHYVDQDTVAIADQSGSLLLFDLRQRQVSHTVSLFGSPSDTVTCAAVSPYEPLVAFGTALGHVGLWDVGSLRVAIDGDAVSPLGLAVGAHASASAGRGLGRHHGGTSSVCFSPASLVSTGSSGTVACMPLIPEVTSAQFT